MEANPRIGWRDLALECVQIVDVAVSHEDCLTRMRQAATRRGLMLNPTQEDMILRKFAERHRARLQHIRASLQKVRESRRVKWTPKAKPTFKRPVMH